MSDRRLSSSSAPMRLVLLSFSMASLIKERFSGCGLGSHSVGIINGRLAVLQKPLVQLLLGEIDHLAPRLVMGNLLACGELVQHALRHADVHARFLECEHFLGGIDRVSSKSSRCNRFSTGSSFLSTDSTAASLSLNRSMNVVLFCIMYMFNLTIKASLHQALR